MGAAHDDRGPVENTTPSTDVSEAEAEAIASETAADQIEDVGLVAPTTDAASPTAVADGPADGAQEQHDDSVESEEDRRHLQQGSGQASPSFGEQQQRVPPTP
jgi:hypothetical protein